MALLVIAVVVPSASVLWFMNEAVASQAAATRAALTDAHRAQLRAARERLRSHWRILAQQLDANLPGHAAEAFERLVVRLLPPGAPPEEEAIAVGAPLPGWEVSFSAPPAELLVSSARRNSYLAVALMAFAAGVVAIAIVGAAARRQTRLAALRSDLVSAVSHERKTPLASMRLLVVPLLDDERLEEAKTRDYLRLMAGENERLTRLIDNFLTFSRLERKRQQFMFKPTRPGDVARQALTAMPESLRGIYGPRVEIDADLPLVTADADALVTVLLNLLDTVPNSRTDRPRERLPAATLGTVARSP